MRPRRGVFVAEEVISEDVSYRVDHDRGSEHIQDLFSPGYFTVDLSDGQNVALVASVETWDMLDIDCDEILQAEQRRLEQLVSMASDLQKDDFAKQLQLAADQFIVQPGARPEEQALAQASGDQARTIIAGYHWFGDWGRDTMISLEGLTLSPAGRRKREPFCAHSPATFGTASFRICSRKALDKPSITRRMRRSGISMRSIGISRRARIATR